MVYVWEREVIDYTRARRWSAAAVRLRRHHPAAAPIKDLLSHMESDHPGIQTCFEGHAQRAPHLPDGSRVPSRADNCKRRALVLPPIPEAAAADRAGLTASLALGIALGCFDLTVSILQRSPAALADPPALLAPLAVSAGVFFLACFVP
jgi:hypothetical protein